MTDPKPLIFMVRARGITGRPGWYCKTPVAPFGAAFNMSGGEGGDSAAVAERDRNPGGRSVQVQSDVRHLARRVFATAIFMPLMIVVGCAAQEIKSPPGTTTTIVLLRHADRNPLQENLTDEGRARAAALPAALADLPIDAIYTLQIQRNLDTAQPLARARNLPVQVIEESYIAPRLVRENPGKTVVWVGNTDNLEFIYRDLRGDGPPPTRYGDIFIVTLPDDGPTLVTKRRFEPRP